MRKKLKDGSMYYGPGLAAQKKEIKADHKAGRHSDAQAGYSIYKKTGGKTPYRKIVK